MQGLGLDAYRFSVAAAHVQPLGKGAWNESGFAFYERLLDALLEAGIRPHVTPTIGTSLLHCRMNLGGGSLVKLFPCLPTMQRKWRGDLAIASPALPHSMNLGALPRWATKWANLRLGQKGP